MQHELFNLHLGFGDALPPLLLGELTQEQIEYFNYALAILSQGGAALPYKPPTLAIANPAGQSLKFSQAKVLEYLAGPNKAKERALLPDVVSYGSNVGQPISYPITKAAIESVDLLEACIMVASFIPTLAKKLPRDIRDTILQNGNQGISKDILYSLYPQKSSKNRDMFDHIKESVVSYILRENTKLAKRKVPSNLGLGLPTEDPTLNIAPIGGGKGLGFLPHNSLIENGYGARSYLQILKDITTKDLGDLDEDVRDFIGFTRTISIDTLTRLKDTKRKPTCCPFASDACKSVCLVDAGQRYATRKTLTGTPIKDITKVDAATGRVSLASMHTAFIANPIVFMRVLVEACLNAAVSHQAEVYAAMIEERVRGDAITIPNIEAYLEKLPCSVRLNIYSDYVWEDICPALFDIFNGKTKFANEGVYPFIQFYDYTKIAGRWDSLQKKRAYKIGELTKREDPCKNYQRPSNYHLTFSYNGSEASRLQGEFCRRIGQNITYVFYSTYATNSLFNKFSEALSPTTEIQKEAVAQFTALIREALALASGYSVADTMLDGSIDSALPTSYQGVPVINGDAYDLRFLDQYAHIGQEGVIVGLTWKGPTNLYIQYKGVGYQINPLSAALALSYAERLKNPAQSTPQERERNVPDLHKKLYASAAFGVVRLFLGEFQIKKEERTIPVSLFISPSGNPSSQQTLELFSRISAQGQPLVGRSRQTLAQRASVLESLEQLTPSISFATETGATFNLTDTTLSDLEAFLTKSLGCSIDVV